MLQNPVWLSSRWLQGDEKMDAARAAVDVDVCSGHRHHHHECIDLGSGGRSQYDSGGDSVGDFAVRPGDGGIYAHWQHVGRSLWQATDLFDRHGNFWGGYIYRLAEPNPRNAGNWLVHFRRLGLSADGAQFAKFAARSLHR